MATKKLQLLGYSQKWLDFGILSPEQLDEQLRTFERKDDQNTEHYRYATLGNFLRGKTTLSDIELAHYIALCEQDSNILMAGSALIDLFRFIDLTDSQFDTLVLRLQAMGDWSTSSICRYQLLRKIAHLPLTDELFEEGLNSKDNKVIEGLIKKASSIQLAVLATNGPTKNIRTMAQNRIKK